MNKKTVWYIIFFVLIVSASYWGYKTYFVSKKPPLYRTEKLSQRSIVQIIKATGYLEVKDLMKIGSIVPGVIQQMLVEENDFVKKNQLIALIDDGKDDTVVRETKAALEKSKAEFAYQTEFYKRQQVLYQRRVISTDTFEQATRDFETNKANVAQKKALHDQAILQFNNKSIKAPDDGLVISKVSSEGETVTLSSPATIIYTIAKNIDQMEAKLEVDENVIGGLKKGMKATLTFDTYPHKIFYGTIREISNSPIKQSGAVSYLATIDIDNSKHLFRPGMSVDAVINIAEKETVVSVPSQIFKINKSILKDIAKTKGFEYQPLSKEQHKELKQQENKKSVWVQEGDAFVEKAVEIGINDNAFFEIVSGLPNDAQIIVDTVEPDAMKEMFSQFFGKGLSK